MKARAAAGRSLTSHLLLAGTRVGIWRGAGARQARLLLGQPAARLHQGQAHRTELLAQHPQVAAGRRLLRFVCRQLPVRSLDFLLCQRQLADQILCAGWRWEEGGRAGVEGGG